jgi:hypothetical protein
MASAAAVAGGGVSRMNSGLRRSSGHDNWSRSTGGGAAVNVSVWVICAAAYEGNCE